MCINSSFIFITGEYSIVWVYHILFIHLPVDRLLGYFCFLGIIHVSLCGGFLFLLGRFLEVELLGLMVSLCLSLLKKKNYLTVFKVAFSFCIEFRSLRV